MKVGCKNPGGLLQAIPILEWKWEVISMYFITGLPKISRKMILLRQHDSNEDYLFK